jgi:hypothetical protein
LDAVSRTAAATRKIAAAGTRYRGSTLDKVAEVREVAEDESKPDSNGRAAAIS